MSPTHKPARAQTPLYGGGACPGEPSHSDCDVNLPISLKHTKYLRLNYWPNAIEITQIHRPTCASKISQVPSIHAIDLAYCQTSALLKQNTTTTCTCNYSTIHFKYVIHAYSPFLLFLMCKLLRIMCIEYNWRTAVYNMWITSVYNACA